MMTNQAQLEDDGTWAWEVYNEDSLIDWDSGYSTYNQAKDQAERRMEELELEDHKQRINDGQGH